MTVRCAGLAVVDEAEPAAFVQYYSTKFHCTIQIVNDRKIGLEIARRSRPTMVLVDGNFLEEYLQDFLARIKARWPALDVIVIRDGESERICC
jgi:DNA-binding response OmpR family regulator